MQTYIHTHTYIQRDKDTYKKKKVLLLELGLVNRANCPEAQIRRDAGLAAFLFVVFAAGVHKPTESRLGLRDLFAWEGGSTGEESRQSSFYKAAPGLEFNSVQFNSILLKGCKEAYNKNTGAFQFLLAALKKKNKLRFFINWTMEPGLLLVLFMARIFIFILFYFKQE